MSDLKTTKNYIDLTNRKLTIDEFERMYGGDRGWHCKCKCGGEAIIYQVATLINKTFRIVYDSYYCPYCGERSTIDTKGTYKVSNDKLITSKTFKKEKENMKIDIDYIKKVLNENKAYAKSKLEEYTYKTPIKTLESYYEGQLLIINLVEELIDNQEDYENKIKR